MGMRGCELLGPVKAMPAPEPEPIVVNVVYLEQPEPEVITVNVVYLAETQAKPRRGRRVR